MDKNYSIVWIFSVLLIVINYANENLALFTNGYPKLTKFPLNFGDDAGTPLFLTPFIDSGKIDDARKSASVDHKDMSDVSSYAGYLTVNKKYNSNMFFWFFPAQVS